MKRTVLVLMAIAGCVSSIGQSWQERCARYGMEVDGITMSVGTARSESHAIGGGPGGIYGASSETTVSVGGQTASCRRPHTHHEACEIRGWVAYYGVTDAWEPEWRNDVIFIGYVAFILPGVLASLSFRDDESKVVPNAKSAYIAAYNACEIEQSTTGAPGSQ